MDKVMAPMKVDFADIPSSADSAYVLSAKTSFTIRQVHLTDTTGVALSLLVNDQPEAYFGPGTDVTLSIVIPTGSKLSIKSLESAPSAGYVILNFLGE